MSINTDYRDGRANATELMQKAFEDSGYIDKGHGKALAWHEGLATYEESNAQRKEEAAKPVEWLVDRAIDALAEGAGTQVAKRIFGAEIVEIAEKAMKPGVAHAKEAAKGLIRGMAGDAIVGLAMVAGGVVTVAAAAKNIADGDRSRDQQDTIGLDLATTQLLTLDADYKHSVFAKYDGNCEPDSVMRLFRQPDGALTEYGRNALPKLQAACDSGSRAGFDAVRSGNLSGYLAAHPEIAARREKDVAFAKGFDQVLFAANCGDGGHKLVSIQKDIDARDARMTAQVPVRG